MKALREGLRGCRELLLLTVNTFAKLAFHVAAGVQENGAAASGVQKSVKTGVANALVALLRCTASEAAPWRPKVT